MPAALEWLVAVSVAGVNGAALLSFWAYTRTRINTATGQIAALQAWQSTVDQRCSERREDMQVIFKKLDEVKTCFYRADNATALAIGKLQGTISQIVKPSDD